MRPLTSVNGTDLLQVLAMMATELGAMQTENNALKVWCIPISWCACIRGLWLSLVWTFVRFLVAKPPICMCNYTSNSTPCIEWGPTQLNYTQSSAYKRQCHTLPLHGSTPLHSPRPPHSSLFKASRHIWPLYSS